MVETSGRDAAMFRYVDVNFPTPAYRKLALRFVVNDLTYAERSVDGRMRDEIRDGIRADFRRLYEMTSHLLDDDVDDDRVDPSPDVVRAYSDYKAAVFSRYRMLSEMLGILLVREATATKGRALSGAGKGGGSNVMVETSGRDAAMFRYVDVNFPTPAYRKLALRFVVCQVR